MVRLHDAYDCRTKVSLTVPNGYTRAYLCDLMENELEEIPVEDGRISLPVANFEIVTIKFKA